MAVKLSRLFGCLDGARHIRHRDADLEITGITCDSRKVVQGNLFVAIPGRHVDGHIFIHEALSKGAAAIITERDLNLPGHIPLAVVPSSRVALARLASGFYGEPSKGLTIVGITGTNGKTTTAYLLRSILEASGKEVGLLGTVHHQAGDELIDSVQTTPDAVELHRLFRKMRDQGTTHVVMEVSSHALDQERTHGIEFHGAVFTNLTMDHLDYHSNMSSYRNAKARLFRDLSPRAFAVLNRGDYASIYFGLQTRARVFWYGLDQGSGIRARLVNLYLGGMAVGLSTAQEEVVVSTGLLGEHNLCNILAAATAAMAMGIGLKDVKRGIESLPPVPGRLERVATTGGYSVFVDYAHTPDAMESVLGALRTVVKNRLLVVFGCGGDRDRGKRPLMGHIGERYADCLWITSDNPRNEDPMDIIKDIVRGISGGAYRVEPDRRRAIESALSEAKVGDVVLIAGKGHEGMQIFSDRVVAFDDRAVVREILAGNRMGENFMGKEVANRDKGSVSAFLWPKVLPSRAGLMGAT